MYRFSLYLTLSAICFQPPSVLAQSESPAPVSVPQLQQAIEEYVSGVSNLRVRTEVTRLVRISNGRLSEKTYHVKSLIKSGVTRISLYGEGVINGEKAWFDIRESLLFASGDTAEWRHPGFPGQINYGQKSDKAKQVRHKAAQLGHPFAALGKMLLVLKRPASKVFRETDSEIVVRTSVLASAEKVDTQTNFIELVFDKRFDLLPVSMTSISTVEDPKSYFDSGTRIEVEYHREEDGSLSLVSVREDLKLKGENEGILNTEWVFKDFDRSAITTMDDMKLKLPLQITSENVDTKQKLTVTSVKDDAALALKKRFGDYIEFQTRALAMHTTANSFVGQCPDLPPVYQLAGKTRPIVATSSIVSRWDAGLLVGHALCLLAIGIYVTRRRQTKSESPTS